MEIRPFHDDQSAAFEVVVPSEIQQFVLLFDAVEVEMENVQSSARVFLHQGKGGARYFVAITQTFHHSLGQGGFPGSEVADKSNDVSGFRLATKQFPQFEGCVRIWEREGELNRHGSIEDLQALKCKSSPGTDHRKRLRFFGFRFLRLTAKGRPHGFGEYETHAFPLALLAGTTAVSPAVAIFSATDAIIGGARVGGDFVEGSEGTTGGVNNWPGAEPPSDLINGIIGGGGEKYLNFAELDTGFIITPNAGPSIVTSMELWVANDAPERDPASFEVWGTNADVSGGGVITISSFTLISSGSLDLPLGRDTVPDATGLSEVVAIGDGNAYTCYMVLFPTVRDSVAANSMQLSEIQFDGVVIPEPGSTVLAALSLGLLLRRRR